MLYSCGRQAEIGDQVLIESGRTWGRVEAIIETADDLMDWQVDEPGLLIKAEPFGLYSGLGAILSLSY